MIAGPIGVPIQRPVKQYATDYSITFARTGRAGRTGNDAVAAAHSRVRLLRFIRNGITGLRAAAAAYECRHVLASCASYAKYDPYKLLFLRGCSVPFPLVPSIVSPIFPTLAFYIRTKHSFDKLYLINRKQRKRSKEMFNVQFGRIQTHRSRYQRFMGEAAE